MALVKVLDKYDLQREFQAMGRDYFSLEGYQALLDLFEECDGEKDTELDVIAICCEFFEATPEEILEDNENNEELMAAKDEIGLIDVNKLVEIINDSYSYAVLLNNGKILCQNF